MNPLTNLSNQSVLALSIAGHRHLETQQPDPFHQCLLPSPDLYIDETVEVADWGIRTNYQIAFGK